jgi:hypothetical protein
LALVLAFAGAASPIGRSGGAAGPQTAAALTGAGVPQHDAQPNASTTVVDVPGDPSAPPPAIRIAATGSSMGVQGVRVDIADVLLAAYRAAVTRAPAGCHLPVSLLAAIGQVESGSLVGWPVDRRHRTSVLGPVLDGHGYATIADTDAGRWDGNATWDRAVGPMQFIPGTWRTFGVDGDGDGVANPQDVEDAAASTAAYLCYGSRDLSDPAVLRAAILSYNHSPAYLGLVLTYQERFAGLGLDDGTTVAGLPTHLALSAVEAAPDGWAAGRVTAHASPARKSGKHHRATPSARGARTAAAAAAAARTAGVPRTTPSPTGTSTPVPASSPPSPSSGSPSPTTDDSGSASPSPETPGPTGDPAPPASTPPSPQPSPQPCPTAPTTPTTPTPGPTGTEGPSTSPDPSPTNDPTAPGDPDATCAPCPEGTDPSPEAPCLPPADPTPTSSTDPSPSPSSSGSATATSEASPSSGP